MRVCGPCSFRMPRAGLRRKGAGVKILTRAEAASRVGKSLRTISRWESEGHLKTLPGGHLLEEHVLEVERVMRSRRGRPKTPTVVGPRFVLLESPYGSPSAAVRFENVRYARAAMRDCLARGEAPFASHLLYTQVLDDADREQRQQGIEAGLEIGRHAVATVAYVDRGISFGMRLGIARAEEQGRKVEFRRLGGEWAVSEGSAE